MKMRPSHGRAQTAAVRALESGTVSHDSLSTDFIWKLCGQTARMNSM